MAQQNRTTLKGYFNTGDVPTEAQFADLIDSAAVKGEDGDVLLTTAERDKLATAVTSDPASDPALGEGAILNLVTITRTAFDERTAAGTLGDKDYLIVENV